MQLAMEQAYCNGNWPVEGIGKTGKSGHKESRTDVESTTVYSM